MMSLSLSMESRFPFYVFVAYNAVWTITLRAAQNFLAFVPQVAIFVV